MGSQFIAVVPVGAFPPELLRDVSAAIELHFGLPVIQASLLDDIAFAYDPERRQYHSTPILEKLALARPPDVLKILAIVREDLFIPILTYVYGEAQLNGTAAVISIHRLTEDISAAGQPELFRDRVLKEALHELGHTFDLRHCKEKGCIMHYCRSIRDVDLKSERMCRYCRVLLGDALRNAEFGIRNSE